MDPKRKEMVGPAGFEPASVGFSGDSKGISV